MSLRKTLAAEKPPYAWIPLRRLQINEAHQGRLYPATIRRLTSDWKGTVEDGRLTLPGCLQIAPVNGATLDHGDFDVGDGLHRVTVARDFYGDDVKLLCQITWDASGADKSAIYLDVNNQHSRHPFDKYRNGVAAGEKHPNYSAYTEVNRTLASLGLEVGENAEVRCPMSLMRVHALGGTGLLASALMLLRATFPNDDDRFTGQMVEGMALFLRKYPDIDRAGFAKKFAKHTAASVIGGARDLHNVKFRMSDFGKSMPAMVAHVLRELYDERRQNKLKRAA